MQGTKDIEVAVRWLDEHDRPTTCRVLAEGHRHPAIAMQFDPPLRPMDRPEGVDRRVCASALSVEQIHYLTREVLERVVRDAAARAHADIPDQGVELVANALVWIADTVRRPTPAPADPPSEAWIRGKADAEAKCESVAAGGEVTPPAEQRPGDTPGTGRPDCNRCHGSGVCRIERDPDGSGGGAVQCICVGTGSPVGASHSEGAD